MAKIFGKDREVDFAPANLMSFGKSFSRMGGQPLDESEVWYDYDALVEFAAGNAAYVGMKVVYVDEEKQKVYQYSVQLDGSLKEIGVAPIGDGKSIAVDAETGTVSLHGFDDLTEAAIGYLPRVKKVIDTPAAEGVEEVAHLEIEWVPVDAVVEGDGNTKTVVQKVEGSKVTVAEAKDTETDTLTYTIGVDLSEYYTSEEVDAAVKVVADKVGVPAEGDTSTATLYERIAAEILRATTAEGELSERIGVAKDGDAAATGVYAYVDGVVKSLVEGVDPDKIDSLNELIAWVEAHPAIVEELDGRLDVVEGILDGIGGEGEKATVKAYVDDAFTAHETAADAKYATKEEMEAYDEAVAETYATKEELKATDDKAVANKNLIDGLDGRIADLEELGVEAGAEVNVIEVVKVNGVELTPDANKAVNVAVPTALDELDGYTELDERVTAAKKAGDDAATAVETLKGAEVKANADAIAAVDARLKTVEGASGTHNTDIATLKGNVATLLAEDEKINEELGEINGKITTEAEARAKRDGELTGLINGNTARLDVIEEKVDLAEGETVKGYVDGKIAAIKEYDDTEVRNLITAEAERADAEEKRIVGLIEAEADRAAKAEKANADAIAEIDALLNTVSSEDAITSLKELAIWVEAHETEVLPQIEANKKAIDALGDKVDTGDKTVSAYVTDAIAGIPAATASTLGLVKASNEVTVTNGVLGLGEVSTDKLVQGTMTLILDGGDAGASAN